MEQFAAWSVRHAGLFTFAQSAKHLALYQKFDFWPRFLTLVMSAPVVAPSGAVALTRLSAVADDERATCIASCAALAGAVYEGLDLGVEIRSVASQGIGDTVLVHEAGTLAAFAVCHLGAGSEAGSGACYVKFGAARPGPGAEGRFHVLLDGCRALAAAEGAAKLVAGVSTACHEAYRIMLARGFRTELQGIRMHRPNEDGYHRPGVYVLDDWR
jgi:hypothetical protein